MMKRILSMLLALLMLASVFPASAFAEDTTATTAATTEATTAPACDTCGNYDCASDHLTWCVICRKDDCGEDHVSAANLEPCDKCGSTDCAGHENWCDRCKTDNCGKEHKSCETCGTVDCTKEHKTCPTCGTVDCTKEHKACETCGTIDCTKEHKACPTCSAVDCTADHTNWCDKCKKDNCGVEHNVLKKLLGSKSVTKTAEPCAYCEATPNADGVIEHTAQCNTKFSVDASADVGKTAIFSGLVDTVLYADSKPNETFDYDMFDGDDNYDFQQAKYDNDNPPLVKIVDAHWEVSGPALWYRVVALDGETLPEGITSDSWIFQRYTNMPDPDNTLFFVDTSLLGKTVGFKNATAVLYSDIYREDSKEVTQEALPVMVVEDIFHDGEKAWYSVNSENWPQEYADYHYVPASAVELVEAPEEAVREEDQTESGLNIAVTGVLPEGTTLSVADVAVNAADFGIADASTIVAAVDIKLLTADNAEYQPYTDESYVKVELDAAKMGLSNGDVVKLYHKHGNTISTDEIVLVVDGKITFFANQFSIYVVENTTQNSGQQITNGSTVIMTVGETKIFYSPGLNEAAYQGTIDRSHRYNKYYVWSAADKQNAINYTVHNTDAGYNVGVLQGNYDPRVAPWITVEAKKEGTATITIQTTLGRVDLEESPFYVLGSETLTISVVDKEDFHIENDIPASGCLRAVGLNNTPGVTYTWTRSDNNPVQPEALVEAGINVSKDRGGVVNGGTPITYTVMAYDATGNKIGEDSYEVLYGSEILNPSFEEPSHISDSWRPGWWSEAGYGYATNGTPGLYWQTTAPGTGNHLGHDIEFGKSGSPHHADPADGYQFVELNAEDYGALYQDILTTPGATFTWQFSHAKRDDHYSSMYVVMAATEKARNIINYADINALVASAKKVGQTIPNTGEGLEFTHNGGTYRIWHNIADQTAVWETISGNYIVPDKQYLTRLFFVSDPESGSSTYSNLIDAVSGGEKMNFIVEYYVDGQLARDEQQTYVSPNTTVPLDLWGLFEKDYKYPVSILVNGRNYPGTWPDLQDGFYVTDYGTKINGTENYRQQIVVQIYFQEPNIVATKIVDVVGMSVDQKNNILQNGGFDAAFKLENDKNSTDTFSASVSITQFSSSGTLTADASFKDSEGEYVTIDDYGKTFTVSETSAKQLDNYKLVTTIKTGNDKNQMDVGNKVTITEDNEIAYIEVTNTYYPMGNLRVSKFVETNLSGIGITNEQKNQEFTFTVTLDGTIPDELRGPYNYKIKEYKDNLEPKDEDTVIYTWNPADTDKAISLSAENTLTFTLKHNQYIVIEDLPAVDYTITETQRDGYQEPSFILDHRYDNTTDGSLKGYIPVGVTEVVTCSNAPVVSLGDLKITKNVVDESRMKDAPKQGFDFTVTLNNVQNPIEQEATFAIEYTYDESKGSYENGNYTLKGGNTSYPLAATVTPQMGADDSYQFTITLYDGLTATIKNLPPCYYYVTEADYSAQKFEANIVNQYGTLGGEKVDGQNPVAAVTCTNTYPMDSGNLIINKTVMKEYDPDPMGADTFTFTIVPGNGVVLDKEEYAVEVNDQKTTARKNLDGNLEVEIPFTSEEMQKVTKNVPLVKSMTIYDLPFGKYTVTEAKNAAYRQSVPENTEDQSNLTVEVTVAENPVEVGFLNEFKRITGTLTITKKVVGTVDGAFLFHVTGTDAGGETIDMDVIIDKFSNGTGSVTIHDLPIGSYTVKEDTNWNWRYTTTADEKTAQITADALEGKVDFTNTYNNSKWLNFFVNTLNEFKLS